MVEVIRAVADQQEATAAQVALAWLRYRADELGVAAAPIPGTRRAARVEENLGSLDVALDDDQLATLDSAATAVTGQPVRRSDLGVGGRE